MNPRQPGLAKGLETLNQQMPLGGSETGLAGLNVVYARFDRTEPFSFKVFDGFDSLRVLTLRKLYETNRSIWEIRRDEVIIRLPQTEFWLQRDIPDWILRPGSKAGQLVLDRKALEEFLDLSFRRQWFPFWNRRVNPGGG